MHRVVRVFAALILAATCLAAARADSAAEKSALAWLQGVDGGGYAASYKQSAPVFQKSITEERWVAALKQVRAPLGKVLSRKLSSSTPMAALPSGEKGPFVVMQFATDFEKKKGAAETVTFMQDHGAWKMAGYFIR